MGPEGGRARATSPLATREAILPQSRVVGSGNPVQPRAQEDHERYGTPMPDRDPATAILTDDAPDHATLRRLLVDEGFLDRADGEYWRRV